MDHRINEKAVELSSEEERHALVGGIVKWLTFLMRCHSGGGDVNQFSLLMTLHPRFKVTAGKEWSHLSHVPQGGTYSALTSDIIMTTHWMRGNSPKGNEGAKGNGCWVTQANRYPLLQNRDHGSRACIKEGRKGGKEKGREKDSVDRRLPPFRSHLIRTRLYSVRHFTCCENWVVFFAPETVSVHWSQTSL